AQLKCFFLGQTERVLVSCIGFSPASEKEGDAIICRRCERETGIDVSKCCESCKIEVVFVGMRRMRTGKIQPAKRGLYACGWFLIFAVKTRQITMNNKGIINRCQ